MAGQCHRVMKILSRVFVTGNLLIVDNEQLVRLVHIHVS
jgi:hypothetical protein